MDTASNPLLEALFLGVVFPGVILADLAATVLGFVPRTGFYVPAALALATITYLVRRPNGIGAALASALAVAGLLTGLFFFPLGYRKQFVRSVHRIEPGTSRAEVARILDGFEKGHPYGGNHGPIGGEEPDVDYWHHGRGGQAFNYDHCVIRYGPSDHVRQVELHLD